MAIINKIIKHDIEKHFKSGMNQSELSRKTGVCRSSVQNVLKKFKNGDGIEQKVGAGSKKLFTLREECLMTTTSKLNFFLSTREI
ncbi:hypothetical protein A3Q56_03735 [Intoshia linei]|uniref:HTH psq-type domain-containing protein n=1 Tax=Intoshia linei TaxID=1819745 RepID=A0A177B2W9_9BILA|nr:hypothetical protein A3Q56_03735 [Intoshia linei]